MNSFAGETPVGMQRSPAVVVEQVTPHKKFPKPSSIGPDVGDVMGPVNPVVLTPGKLNAMVSDWPNVVCNTNPDAAVKSTTKV